MSKKLLMGLAPMLAAVALAVMPAIAQASPHYYKNFPPTVEYPEGKRIPFIAWGRLTLQVEPIQGRTSCENMAGGYVENPVGGGAGIGETLRFATWNCNNGECLAGEVEVAPGVKAEKEFELISLPQSFPWPSELLEEAGPVIRTESTEVEWEVACMAHRIGPFSNSTANKNEFEPTRANLGEGDPKGAGVNEQGVFTAAKTLEGNPTVLCKTTTAAETGGPKEQKPQAENGTGSSVEHVAKVSFTAGSGELSCANGAFGVTVHESMKIMGYNGELINVH